LPKTVRKTLLNAFLEGTREKSITFFQHGAHPSYQSVRSFTPFLLQTAYKDIVALENAIA
jgi:hypothetical protein